MKKNRLEWTVFGVSLLIILGILVPLVVEAVFGRDGPPEIKVVHGEPFTRGGSTIVPFTVSNKGGKTAEGVALEAEVGDETASVDIQFLPRNSERHGSFVFDRPVQKSEVKVRVLGYEEP